MLCDFQECDQQAEVFASSLKACKSHALLCPGGDLMRVRGFAWTDSEVRSRAECYCAVARRQAGESHFEEAAKNSHKGFTLLSRRFPRAPQTAQAARDLAFSLCAAFKSFQEAKSLLNLAISIDTPEEGEYDRLLLAQVLLEEQNFSEARVALESLISSDLTEDLYWKALIAYGRCELPSNKVRAESLLRSVVAHTELKYPALASTAYLALGDVLVSRDEPKLAEDCFERSLKIQDFLNCSTQLIAASQLAIARSFFARGFYDEALRFCNDSLLAFRGLHDRYQEAQALTIAADLSLRAGDCQAAVDRYQNAANCLRSFCKCDQAAALLKLAAAYHRAFCTQQAKRTYLQVLRLLPFRKSLPGSHQERVARKTSRLRSDAITEVMRFHAQISHSQQTLVCLRKALMKDEIQNSVLELAALSLLAAGNLSLPQLKLLRVKLMSVNAAPETLERCIQQLLNVCLAKRKYGFAISCIVANYETCRDAVPQSYWQLPLLFYLQRKALLSHHSEIGMKEVRDHIAAELLLSLENAATLDKLNQAVTVLSTLLDAKLKQQVCVEAASAAYYLGLYLRENGEKGAHFFSIALDILTALKQPCALTADVLIAACTLNRNRRHMESVDAMLLDTQYDELLQPCERTAQFYMNRGSLQRTRKEFAAALKTFERANSMLENSKKRAKVLLTLISLHLDMHSLQCARESLHQAEKVITALDSPKIRETLEAKRDELLAVEQSLVAIEAASSPSELFARLLRIAEDAKSAGGKQRVFEAILTTDLNSAHRAECAVQLARLHAASARYSEALPLYSLALDSHIMQGSDVSLVAQVAQQFAELAYARIEDNLMRQVFESATQYCCAREPNSPHTAQLLESAGKHMRKATIFESYTAVEYYKKAYASYPHPMERKAVFDRLIEVYSALEEFERAEALYRDYLETQQYAQAAKCWSELGTLFEKSAQFERAEECFLAALSGFRRWPRRPTDVFCTQVCLGRVSVKLGKWDFAEQCFQAASDMLRPRSFLAILVPALLCRSACLLPNCFLSIQPAFQYLLAHRINCQQYSEAERLCLDALALSQKSQEASASLHSLLASLYFKINRCTDAQRHFEIAASCESVLRAKFEEQLAQFYASQWQFERQEALYRQAAGRDKNSTESFLRLAHFYQAHKQPKQTNAVMKQALLNAALNRINDVSKISRLFSTIGEFYVSEGDSISAELCYRAIACICLRSRGSCVADINPLLQHWGRSEKADEFISQLLGASVPDKKACRRRIRLQLHILNFYRLQSRMQQVTDVSASLSRDMSRVAESLLLFEDRDLKPFITIARQMYSALEEAFAACIASYRDVPSLLLAVTLAKVGLFYHIYASSEAKRLLKHAVACFSQVSGSGIQMHKLMLSLAMALQHNGDIAEAEQTLHQWLATLRASNSPRMIDTLLNLANIYESGMQSAQVESCLQEAQSVFERMRRDSCPLPLRRLGRLYCAQGRGMEAEQCFARALASTSAAWDRASGLELAALRRSRNMYAESEKLLVKSMPAFRQIRTLYR